MRTGRPATPARSDDGAAARLAFEIQRGLLKLAEREFDVFLTADQNLEHQQKIGRFRLGIVVLVASRNRIESYLPLIEKIAAAVDGVSPGTVVRVAA